MAKSPYIETFRLASDHKRGLFKDSIVISLILITVLIIINVLSIISANEYFLV